MERKIICIGVISMLLLLGVTSFSVVATGPSDAVGQPKLQIQILLPKPIFSKTPDVDLSSSPRVQSGSRFGVRVTADSAVDDVAGDKPVCGAVVKMIPLRQVPTLFSIASKRVYLTGIDGIAWIKAPFVLHDSLYKITANKKGYASAEVTITVTPRLAIVHP